MTEKLCPLRFQESQQRYQECKREECAWWCEETNCCVFVAIDNTLGFLASHRYDIIKMGEKEE